MPQGKQLEAFVVNTAGSVTETRTVYAPEVARALAAALATTVESVGYRRFVQTEGGGLYDNEFEQEIQPGK